MKKIESEEDQKNSQVSIKRIVLWCVHPGSFAWVIQRKRWMKGSWLRRVHLRVWSSVPYRRKRSPKLFCRNVGTEAPIFMHPQCSSLDVTLSTYLRRNVMICKWGKWNSRYSLYLQLHSPSPKFRKLWPETQNELTAFKPFDSMYTIST